MNYEILLRPESEHDINAAYQWYEQQDDGLGDEFLRSIEATFSTIQRAPLSYPLIQPGIRRALLRRFPYGLYYLVESDRIVVLACLHVRREPKQWQN